MADVKYSYPADTDLTITLASLATSSTLTAGRESTVRDNTSNKYLDELLSGKVTVGTSPTASTQIEVWVLGALDDAPTYPDVFDGTDSAETVTSAGVKFGFLKLAAVMSCDSTTSDRTYFFGPVSVASLFGGTLPPRWSVFVTHNTGVNLNATGSNHQITAQPVFVTVT